MNKVPGYTAPTADTDLGWLKYFTQKLYQNWKKFNYCRNLKQKYQKFL